MRPITFLSDYGYRDEFAGVCRAVIARIAPGAQVIDLTHGIRRHAVREGATVLANALPYAPPGVHLAVVDPGVGSDRRPIAVRVAADDRILVGPDNGLLSTAIARYGGAVEVADLSASPFRLQPVSATFHGRDLFAPVAARLALGASLAEAGSPIGPAAVREAPGPAPRIEAERAVAHAIAVDGFGNVTLDLAPDDLDEHPLGRAEWVRVEAPAGGGEARRGLTFADVPEGRLLLYEDSSGALALAVNRGDAAAALGITVGEAGDEIELRPAPSGPSGGTPRSATELGVERPRPSR